MINVLIGLISSEAFLLGLQTLVVPSLASPLKHVS